MKVEFTTKQKKEFLEKLDKIEVQKLINKIESEPTEQILRKDEIQYVAQAVVDKYNDPSKNCSFYVDELNKNKEKLRQKNLTLGEKTVIIMKNKYLSFVISNYNDIF